MGERERLSDERRRGLQVRARVLAAIRSYFDELEFLEVETPTLVRSPGLEVHLEAVPAGDRYLITSPEYHMKRLLVAGFERIYTVTPCFRAKEHGRHHSVEFTMLEWYRGNCELDAVKSDTESLVAAVAKAIRGSETVEISGRVVDVTPPWQVRTVSSLVEECCGFELRGDESAAEFHDKANTSGLSVGSAREWDDIFYKLFVDHVEPVITAMDRALFITEWPVRLAALAKSDGDNPAVVHRFEAYVGGVELANAFGELCDAREQRRRFEDELAQRRRLGKTEYPLDEMFLAALVEGMPPSAGIALGVDRLAMLVAGADSLAQVQAFSGDEI